MTEGLRDGRDADTPKVAINKDAEIKMLKSAFGIFGCALLAIGIVVGVAWGVYALYATFAPKYEGVRRDVMIESRYYTEATIRRLRDLKIQYDATPVGSPARPTLANAAKHEAAVFPRERLPLDLRNWLASLGS